MAYDSAGLVKLIRSSLERHPRTTLTVLSRQLRVERHTIERLTRIETGLSFRELQREIMRTKISKYMHEHANMSFKEIAGHVGYGSQQTLGRFIRRVWGVPPKQLRSRRERSECANE